MKTQAKRKLLSLATLRKVSDRDELGVPLTRIISDLELDISRPHLRKLISYYTASPLSPQVLKSIAPKWVDPTSAQTQIQPNGWVYSGVFPFGEWINENN